LLSVSHLTKNFGKFTALNEVSFEVNDGDVLLLLGPNGAGKTTAIRCILGLLNFRGQIKLDSLDARGDGVLLREKIGYVPQQSSYYENIRILDQGRLMARFKKASFGELKSKLEMVGLWSVNNRQVKSLSSGMKQRLGIALALLNDPPLLIFDEPTSNVDLSGQLEFQGLLQRFSGEGKTMLITTHLTGLDRYVDEVVVLDSGKIVAKGSPQQLLARLGATDTVFIRLELAEIPEALSLLNQNGFGAVTTKEDWLLFSVSTAEKAKLLGILSAHSLVVKDIVIQPRDIESEYLRLSGNAEN